MQPRELGIEVTKWHETSEAGCPKVLARDHLSYQGSALHLVDWCFLLKDCCAFAICHTLLCILMFVIKSPMLEDKYYFSLCLKRNRAQGDNVTFQWSQSRYKIAIKLRSSDFKSRSLYIIGQFLESVATVVCFLPDLSPPTPNVHVVKATHLLLFMCRLLCDTRKHVVVGNVAFLPVLPSSHSCPSLPSYCPPSGLSLSCHRSSAIVWTSPASPHMESSERPKSSGWMKQVFGVHVLALGDWVMNKTDTVLPSWN